MSLTFTDLQPAPEKLSNKALLNHYSRSAIEPPRKTTIWNKVQRLSGCVGEVCAGRSDFKCRSLLKLCPGRLLNVVFVASLTGIFAHILMLGINALPLAGRAQTSTHMQTPGDSVAFRMYIFDPEFPSFLYENRIENSIFKVSSCEEVGDGGRAHGPSGQMLRKQPFQQPFLLPGSISWQKVALQILRGACRLLAPRHHCTIYKTGKRACF